MTPPPIPLLKKPSRKRLYVWIAIVAALLVLITIGTVRWLQGQIEGSGFTTDTRRVQIIIGNDVVKIPANMIRFERQRQSDTLNQVDLAVLWPKGEGYGTHNKREFQNTGENQKLIFVTLEIRKLDLDMDGRLAPIYLKLFEGISTSGPAGLALQPLRRGAGYDGEQLALYARDSDVWVARCQNPGLPTVPTCLRDIHVGNGLSLRYRFPIALLKDWRQIEALMRNLARSFLDIQSD